MATRIPWDRYEAALLLDYCLRVEKGEMTKDVAVAEVSQRLRQRAIKKALKIDDIFRNENGISMQMSSMSNCYHGKSDGLSISKLFHETVDLYKTNPGAFKQILSEETMEIQKDTWKQFELWLEKKYPETKEQIFSSLRSFNALGRKNGLLKTFINNINDPDKIKNIQNEIINSKRKFFQSKKLEKNICTALDIYNQFLLDNQLNNSETVNEQSIKSCDVTNDCSDKNDIRDIFEILFTYFKFGISPDSLIDILRFRSLAEDENINLPEDDQDLKDMICSAGILIGNKIYAINAETICKTGALLSDAFKNGFEVVFIQSLFDKNQTWLEENHIFSVDILKEVLKVVHPEYYFGTNLITPGERRTEREVILTEIQRVSDNIRIVLLNQLANKLIYIPEEKLSSTLSSSSEFIWLSNGKYLQMKYFILDENDVLNILNFVESECKDKGYASITDIPLGNILDENDDLSINAIYQAIYLKIFKDNYCLNGKIISSKNNDVDIQMLLKEFCKDREECSVSEMTEKAKELTGNPNRQNSLIILYGSMIRVGIDKFVSEKRIQFNIEEIEKILNGILGDRFAPIKAIPNFLLFPDCGHSWNYYILESYCYRFSPGYSLMVLNYNDKNAGVIVTRGLEITYDEILSEAVAQTNIRLTKEDVDNYLCDNGYLARHNYKNINKIIEKAKTIREEK